MITGLATSGNAMAPASNIEPVVVQEWNYPVLSGSLSIDDNGQCVNYAKVLSGIYRSGHAINWSNYINSYAPSLKSVVVFDRSSSVLGHLAVVVKIEDNKITISERNYQGPWIISERVLDANDPSILGYVVAE